MPVQDDGQASPLVLTPPAREFLSFGQMDIGFMAGSLSNSRCPRPNDIASIDDGRALPRADGSGAGRKLAASYEWPPPIFVSMPISPRYEVPRCRAAEIEAARLLLIAIGRCRSAISRRFRFASAGR